ncbi:MAG: hypothetical protein ACI4KH_05870 [Oscillospiraceae bacterium]
MKYYYAYNPEANCSERISENKLRQELRRCGKAQDHNIDLIRKGETVKTDFAEYSTRPRGRVI